MFLQGAGIGNVMPPSTSAIMASVPRAKAGEGSAIGNTSRQLGGALGVAILGSISALPTAPGSRRTWLISAARAQPRMPCTRCQARSRRR